ncbi:hypothetical protein EN781_00195 [Mesorhizobium sp. M4A.F.Ca.ET.090.04.2.1]|uniref:hypothetical protein n=1 Tax=Mesorhizobium sp. M4A.F.Ca.ET.090.04.2.1 TaxID=2496663 RepID=UPI000FCAC06E|nr:hypothetical protein [Mesorhizobium sp. M4A.F.Ca.ET.090.04.2.1]RVC47591.1 hypothetical protein EN781_00195 [Mesorhizobium sp. M4A.F.Ca.ET.090.04.2.1]
MPTVTIGGNTYTTYSTVTDADIYLGGSTTADAWRAADADTKARGLVSATRWIDEQSWVDAYSTFDLRLANPAFINACIELAALLVDDADFRTTFGQVQQKRIKAGSVEIENFRGTTVQTDTAFPSNVMLLIGQYLAGSEPAFGGAITFGTCRETTLDEGYGFNRGIF